MGGTCHRMDNHCMPRQLLYGELEAGKREQGCPRKRYKDTVNGDLWWCDIQPPQKLRLQLVTEIIGTHGLTQPPLVLRTTAVKDAWQLMN